jgi:hypothetical protein
VRHPPGGLLFNSHLVAHNILFYLFQELLHTALIKLVLEEIPLVFMQTGIYT